MKKIFNKIMLMFSTIFIATSTSTILCQPGRFLYPRYWGQMGMNKCPITRWALLLLIIVAIIALIVWTSKQIKK
ncbi:hypothetical protein KAT08_01470 [Candidatus Babeliales bacterium]|nr:hypothetical protein [Candidatus Babeliales bacterium]